MERRPKDNLNKKNTKMPKIKIKTKLCNILF